MRFSFLVGCSGYLDVKSRQGMECFEANRAFGALRRDIFESNNHSMGGVLRYSLTPRDGLGDPFSFPVGKICLVLLISKGWRRL